MQENNSNSIHNVIMEGRKKISVSGAQDMECFDDGKVVIYTSMRIMQIKGKNFHMNKLSLDTEEIIVEGDIDSIIYESSKPVKQGFLNKILG